MPSSFLPGVSHACFGLSYLLALACELAWQAQPARKGLRTVGLLAGAAGLLAHTLYLAYQHPSPAEPFAALLLVAWVLGVFYLYGSIHHARRAWAIFVLPVILALVGLSLALLTGHANAQDSVPPWIVGDRTWGLIHGLLILLAAVGVSVAFLASAMYLVQSKRLRNKASPQSRLKLLSLEKLEAMNRRAINLAFPLLTAGLVLGGILLRQNHDLPSNWFSLKVLGTAGLWLVFLVLVYLRYGAGVAGRKQALFTIVAFVIMLLILVAVHPFAEGAK